jgi:LAO/AO transport system kinase
VTKADGDTQAAAERTLVEHGQALGLLRPPTPSWRPRILATSAATGAGIEAVWEMVQEHRAVLTASGELQARRRAQARAWMWSLLEEGLRASFREHPGVAERIEQIERDVEALKTTPAAAARALLQAFQQG